MKTKIKLFALFLFRLSGLFMLSRLLTRKQMRILCYHGGCLGDEGAFNHKLFLSATTLRSRLEWLRRYNFDIISLDQAADALEPGTPTSPLRTVITFDDGWFSTGSELVPVLAELNLPSTLYLCTQHMNEGWPVLAVTVRYLLWKAQGDHASIVGIDPRVDGEYDLRNGRVREALAVDLADVIEGEATVADQVYYLLEKLAKCLGIEPGTLNLRDRRFAYLTPAELRKVADSGCSIELHGHRHRYPMGDPESFERDLQRCREAIVAAGLPEPRHYCYPSGTYDTGATKVLNAMAIRTGTTCVPGLVAPNNPANAHYLPRFLDGGKVHMLEFEAEMSGFTALLRRALGKAG